MQNILDKAYDKYAQTSSAPSKAHTELLCDPNLVEDYSDILKTMPKKLRQDEENNSVNGSVVMNSGSAPPSPEKPSKSAKDGSELGSLSPSQHIQTQQQPNKAEADPASDTDYEYSDSEFEEDMESRLQDLKSGAKQGAAMKFFDGNNSGRSSPDNGYQSSSSDEDDLTTSRSIVNNGEQYISPDEEDDDDDEMDDDFQPLAPPEEIDPNKLYALYPFQGPDPSHCQLYQDQGCVLLNDQDSYWWLVKRCDDGKIGFAPAEILETFPERLARLNCWKNENMSSHSVTSAQSEKEQVSIHSEGKDVASIPYDKGNKSVSFNDVVSYAERYSVKEKASINMSDSEEFDDTEKEESNRDKSTDTVGEIYEAALQGDDDDASVVVSDVSFTTGGTLPLHVKKVRNAELDKNCSLQSKTQISDAQNQGANSKNLLTPIDDGLRQIFQAPTIPFAGHKEIPKSNSNYSISTIGDYSPSSSEWTNDSPQANNGKFDVAPSASDSIPSTRAIKDISKLVNLAKNENYEKIDKQEMSVENMLVVNREKDQESEQSTIHETSQDQKLKDVKPLAELRSKSHDKVESRALKDSPTETSFIDYSMTQQNSHRESTSASSDDSCIDEGRGTSATTINSTISFGDSKHNHHPVVHELYNPLFGRIDDLLQKLNCVMNE
ncbi:LANO_0B08042g1_1 [Lachancea nothofagi CBS 11611]|uniref:LANO_0B08042g1_1 n=1 Tax=Lachancea nothofagi CBS 11611 TaxID=1266666 RepID=A0A1G4J0B5_9SACH|nr:LANO_0B08042g1_1 [Lachancea nothofagi CBS 11611]